jgi:hypothetical protein
MEKVIAQWQLINLRTGKSISHIGDPFEVDIDQYDLEQNGMIKEMAIKAGIPWHEYKNIFKED